MVTETDVAMAYRLILGREPESEKVVRGHVVGNPTMADLRRTFLTSDEFRANFGAAVAAGEQPFGVKPLVWPPIPCEVEVSPGTLQALIARVEQQFEFLGRTEPYWSVVSQEQFRASTIKENEAEFFRSGKGVVDDLRVAAARYGLDLNRYKTCFELGCGLGRSTIWLADLFPQVIGADISASHLELARASLDRFDKSTVRLLQVKAMADFEAIPPYDVFFSIIVLQHNPPPVIAFLLRTILRKLASGGVAYFQVPTYGLNYEFVAAKYLGETPDLSQPGMHILPQADLFRIIDEAGCRPIEVREDAAAGDRMISTRILVQKGTT